MIKKQTTKCLITTAAAIMVLGACTPTISERGNIVKDYQIEQVAIGVHTRLDVLKIMGSPTTQAPFNDNLWYYIGQKTEKRGVFDPKVAEERIVAVKFDPEGIVRVIEDVESERVGIPIERSKTKTHGNEITLPQQLLGNLGKFNRPQQ